MTPDAELLRRYATTDDEAAFAEVVRRQVSLVYSVALRVTNGNTALAEDVAQAVFTDLARKAGPLSHHPALAGWLHTSARFAAIKAVRSEQRRQAHEKEASTMQSITHSPDFDWEQLRPVLDEAVSHLRETDRTAVVLRFFQGLSHREVGEALGLNENTARKRIDQALEKMRAHFAKMGITVSSTLLATTLSAHPTTPAPVGLAEKITQPSLAGAASGAGGGIIALTAFRIFLMSTQTKIALLAAIIIVALLVAFAIKPSRSDNPPAVATKTEVLAATPKVSPPTSAVAAPVLSSVPVSAKVQAAPAAMSAPPADPRASVDTTIAEAIRALENTDMAAFFKEVIPPDQLASAPPGALEQMAQMNMMDPDIQTKLHKSLDPLRFIQGQKPVMSDDGNTATFETDMPLPDGTTNHVEIILKKQSGLWYFSRMPK